MCCFTFLLLLFLMNGKLFANASTKSPLDIATRKQKCNLQAYRVPIKVHGCVETSILVDSCLGACLSIHCPREEATTPSHVKFHNFSNCCHVTEAVNVTVLMKCIDSFNSEYFISHIVQSAKACSCQKCRF